MEYGCVNSRCPKIAEDEEMFYAVSGSLPPTEGELVGQGFFTCYLMVQDES